jgi:hypothetical protein
MLAELAAEISEAAAIYRIKRQLPGNGFKGWYVAIQWESVSRVTGIGKD